MSKADIEAFRQRRLERLLKRSKMEYTVVKMTDIKPYNNNPRYNESGVDGVEQSIEQCGYIQSIILDENNVILAGHTRFIALYDLGYEEVDVIRIEGLTEEQKTKFRLLDNKLAEIAEWDLDKLKIELDGLDFGNFEYFNKEIEKMADIALKPEAEEDDEGEGAEKVEREETVDELIYCPKCGKPINGSFVDMEGIVEDG